MSYESRPGEAEQTTTPDPAPAPWTVDFRDGMWEVTCSDGSLGGRFPREGDARTYADVAGPGPMTIVSQARLGRLEEQAAELAQAEYSARTTWDALAAACAREAALLAELARLRPVVDAARARKAKRADDAPAVWWSPSFARVGGLIWEHPYYGGLHDVRDVPMGTGIELPSDAVRLVPAAAPTPTGDARLLDMDRDAAIEAAADAVAEMDDPESGGGEFAHAAVMAAIGYLSSQPYPVTLGPARHTEEQADAR